MEAAGLGLFMISAGIFATLFENPDSPVRREMIDPLLRRILMGFAMGLTAAGIIYSPWGKQSGAHINPAVTLTFFWLGKIEPWDAAYYIIAQFTGAMAGIFLVAEALGNQIGDPSVNYVVTLPGPDGTAMAFLAEFLISSGLMWTVLFVSNIPRLARFTGLFVAALLTLYIIVEAPYSGMSMNPARSFGSALLAHHWTALWIYFMAPPLGMLAAARVYTYKWGFHNII
ncbi:MAG: aquaporin, partial [Nitrospirae bacterium]|nr:aquaporin [Nitrospirota bacterium]